MIVEASNPLLACSNPDGRLDRAFEKLELLICIDLFRNEVGNLALIFCRRRPGWSATKFRMRCKVYGVYAGAVYDVQRRGAERARRRASRVVDLQPPRRSVRRHYVRQALAGDIIEVEYALAYSKKEWQRKLALTPKKMISGMLKQAGLPDADTFVREHTHGILLAENRGDNYLGSARVLTDDGLVDLAPTEYLATFKAKIDFLYADELANRDAFK